MKNKAIREERIYNLAQLRADPGPDGRERIRGYAAIFNSWSEDLGGFRERIRPGAFAKTLQEADIRALWNHDSGVVLGRNKSGTLELVEDEIGLRVVITPPDTQNARDVMELIRRGDVDSMSFGFRTIRDEWNTKANPPERELIEVALFDVSPVTYPAYPATTVNIRELQPLNESDAPGQAAHAEPVNAAEPDKVDLETLKLRLQIYEKI